jgi:hypothetical protein
MTLYDDDFVSWTQQQATLLRSMPGADVLDIENLVDEIEGLGRAAVAELEDSIRRVLVGLVDLNREPGSVDVELIYSAQYDAIMRLENGVWRHVDLEKIWKLAVRSMPGFPDQCPFTLDYLLAEDFDGLKAGATIRS